MKRVSMMICGALLASTAFAQHTHMHVYRNDKTFTTNKLSDISETRFQSRQWGDWSDQIQIVTKEGAIRTVGTWAVDSIVFGPNVPEIRVNLLDYPDAEDLFKDLQHDKTTIYRATVEMDGNGLFDDLEATEVEFRGRGNTTWTMPKTPYRFKFPKKRSICGLEKAKTYALIANYIDGSQMRNTVAFEIARMLGLPFTNHAIPVNVYLNNRYRGAYFLTEKIGIGGASVDIDESAGMLFEIDSNYDEEYKFHYQFQEGAVGLNMPVMVKDPYLKELAASSGIDPDSYFEKWKTDMSKMMDAVTKRKTSESLSDVLDVETAADYVLVYLLTGNHELKHPKSCYMWKESLDPGARYHFGPVWDFDWAYTYDGWDGAARYDDVLLPTNGACGGWAFFRHLVQNEEIRARIDARFKEFRENMWPELKHRLDEYAALVEPSAKTNGLKWPSDNAYGMKSTFDFRQNYTDLIKYLDRRISWIATHPTRGLY